MEIKTFGYCRVSSKDQNIERQLNSFKEFGIKDRDIYIDKVSGAKEFTELREQYNLLKQNLRKADVLVIQSLDRLSRNYTVLKNEWEYITKTIGADIVVLDMPLLDTRTNKDLMGTFISDLVIQILSFFSETEREFIKKRQRQGIDNALNKGVKFGRKVIEKPQNFDVVINEWKNKNITAKKAMELLGLKINTFYKMVKDN